MSRVERYARCVEISVMHGFYRAAPPVSLRPDGDTEQFLRRSGWLFRGDGTGRWVLLRPEGEGFDEGFSPRFAVVPYDPAFCYVTERAEVRGGTFDIVDRPRMGGVLTTGRVTRVELVFHPPAKRLEFILIPCHTDVSAAIVLREVRGRITFRPPVECSLLGFERVWRVVSDLPTVLSEVSDSVFQLWEVRGSGERLLAGRVPPPAPGESSIADPHGSITRYFYY